VTVFRRVRKIAKSEC